MNCLQLLINTVEKNPDKPAVVFRGEPITYSALWLNIKKFAKGLSDRGIGPGSHVALLLGNSPHYIISYFGVLATGATVVPLNPQYKDKELAFILNNADAHAVIYVDLLEPIIQLAKPNLETTSLFIEVSATNPACTWNQIIASEPIEAIGERAENSIAQILYTSGTTGTPKGVMLSDENLAWMAELIVRELNVWEEDRIKVVLPIFHTLAKMAGLWAPFTIGATIYLEERFVPDDVLEQIEKEEITVFYGVPAMFALFLMSPKLKDYDYSSLRLFGSGGASIPVEIIERIQAVFPVKLSEAYGQTEATIMITCQPLNGEKVPGSVGQRVEGIDLRIVDPNDLDVPQGEVGEIVFKGKNAMLGYYKNPEATAATVRNGWVHTGDLAYEDVNGNIFIVDRIKDMIIRGGYNVYPREIEEVLFKHPAIVECAVIGEPHEILGEEIVAYIVAKEEVSEEALVNFCKENLANFKVPRSFRFLDALPKNATGKILKEPLKKMVKESPVQ